MGLPGRYLAMNMKRTITILASFLCACASLSAQKPVSLMKAAGDGFCSMSGGR